MKEHADRLRDISEIRSLMEQSTKFISLSGLSGISAGVVALMGAGGAYAYLVGEGLYDAVRSGIFYAPSSVQLLEVTGIGLLILLAAVAVASFFSIRLARKKGVAIWNKTAARLLINLAIPLVAGGIFCILLAYYGFLGMVVPATLIFYGMALLNAGKYTLREVRYLGISEIVLGLIAACFLGYGIVFWALGFGILHIVYGVVMYYKYEQ